MNQSKHYTAKDIERYHSGQLSAAEMHAMEKAALDDPFLADALEGYTHTSNPENDLGVLQQKLQLRIEKDRRKRGIFFLNNWMRVAALFILVAGGGWLVYNTLSSGSKMYPEVATTQPAPKQVEKAVPGITTADSVSVFSDAPATESIVTAPRQQTNNYARNDVARNGNIPALPASPSAPAAATSVAPESKDQAPTVFAEGYNRGYVDSIAGFSKTNDALAKKEKEADKDSVTNITVVLKPTPMNPDEVVVLNNRKIERTVATPRQRVIVDTLEPAEGWTNFDDYIANNLKQPEELKTKPLRGAVELAFDVNQNGEPVNITVIKSLCRKCDEEAIRLLKEGPKWKKNKKKGKVTIRF